jgi:hypothetical protein
MLQRFKKKKRKEKNLLCLCFLCVFVALQVMTRELVVKMECNLCNPMKTFKKICGPDVWKEIGKAILGRQRNETSRK